MRAWLCLLPVAGLIALCACSAQDRQEPSPRAAQVEKNGAAGPTGREQPPDGDGMAAQADTAEPTPGEPSPDDEPRSGVHRPALPRYVTVQQRREPGLPAGVEGALLPGYELMLETANVQRFRLMRDLLDVPPGVSIVLRVDRQVIEWRGQHDLIELERDRNGVWDVVRRAP